MATETKPKASKSTTPATPDQLLDAYYDSGSSKYLIKDTDGTWIQLNDRSFYLHLEQAGFKRKKLDSQRLSQAEAALLWYQKNRNITYSGPVAGYDAGLILQGGSKVLVTHSPRHPAEAPLGTPWPMLRAIMGNMFDTPELNQSNYFHLWMKVSDECLRTKNFIPSPVVVLAGPAKSAKTLLSMVVTEILGGRTACPYRYMMGETIFNKDLIGAEVLIIDDEAASKDLRTRRKFGSQIKSMLFAGPKSGHGKNQNANSISPFWRMMILLNDETENLLVMPPLDESLWDKIMLLRTFYSPMPMATPDPESKARFWKAIQAEIPAYLAYLRHEFISPATFTLDPRTCTVPFKHPDLLHDISELLPEIHVLNIIDDAILCDCIQWYDTSEKLTSVLTSGPYAFELRRLLGFSGAMGTYLARLCKSHPHRVHRAREANSRKWVIARDPNKLYTPNVLSSDLSTPVLVTGPSPENTPINRVFNQ